MGYLIIRNFEMKGLRWMHQKRKKLIIGNLMRVWMKRKLATKFLLKKRIWKKKRELKMKRKWMTLMLTISTTL